MRSGTGDAETASPDMSAGEAQLLRAFRTMDDERQLEMLGFAEDVAQAFPRGPRLRLVTPTAKSAGAADPPLT
jgi:hypothetical protein